MNNIYWLQYYWNKVVKYINYCTCSNKMEPLSEKRRLVNEKYGLPLYAILKDTYLIIWYIDKGSEFDKYRKKQVSRAETSALLQ